MKKTVIHIGVAVLFLAGFALLAYPFVANEWNSYRQKQLMKEYKAQVGALEEEEAVDYAAERARAQAYIEVTSPECPAGFLCCGSGGKRAGSGVYGLPGSGRGRNHGERGDPPDRHPASRFSTRRRRRSWSRAPATWRAVPCRSGERGRTRSSLPTGGSRALRFLQTWTSWRRGIIS